MMRVSIVLAFLTWAAPFGMSYGAEPATNAPVMLRSLQGETELISAKDVQDIMSLIGGRYSKAVIISVIFVKDSSHAQASIAFSESTSEGPYLFLERLGSKWREEKGKRGKTWIR